MHPVTTMAAARAKRVTRKNAKMSSTTPTAAASATFQADERPRGALSAECQNGAHPGPEPIIAREIVSEAFRSVERDRRRDRDRQEHGRQDG